MAFASSVGSSPLKCALIFCVHCTNLSLTSNRSLHRPSKRTILPSRAPAFALGSLRTLVPDLDALGGGKNWRNLGNGCGGVF